MGLIIPGSGVRVPPGAFSFFSNHQEEKNIAPYTFINGMPRWRDCTARQTSNLKVVGLSPTRGTIFLLLIISGGSKKKKVQTPPVGLEPTISPLGGVRLVH